MRYYKAVENGHVVGLAKSRYVQNVAGFVEISKKEYMQLTNRAVDDHVYTPLELAQQAITDQDLALIEHGQAMTDLELMILTGGTQNV